MKRREAEAAAEETFEERMEDAAHRGIEQLRGRFEEVVARNGLRNAEMSAELAEMLTRPGARLSAGRSWKEARTKWHVPRRAPRKGEALSSWRLQVVCLSRRWSDRELRGGRVPDR